MMVGARFIDNYLVIAENDIFGSHFTILIFSWDPSNLLDIFTRLRIFARTQFLKTAIFVSNFFNHNSFKFV